MDTNMGIDHVTLCVKNLEEAEYLFTKVLGFEVIWSARDVGGETSSMDTIVVQRGNAKVALMQGINKNGKSQICEFIEKYGEGVQHIAIEVDDIERVSKEWEARGVKFIGAIKDGCDGVGPLRQRFTYQLFPGCGMFLELTQRKHGQTQSKTFARDVVESLYRDIERDQGQGVERTIIEYQRVPGSNDEDQS